jgi:hypothetical protein
LLSGHIKKHKYPAQFSGKLKAYIKRKFIFIDFTRSLRLTVSVTYFLFTRNELKQPLRLTDLAGSNPSMKI